MSANRGILTKIVPFSESTHKKGSIHQISLHLVNFQNLASGGAYLSFAPPLGLL